MYSGIKSASKPKVVFLDWNKTLSNSLFWEDLSDLSNPYHHLESQIIEWLFVKNKSLIKEWMRGQYTCEEICEKMSKDLNIDYGLILKELVKSCVEMKYSDPAIPGLIKQIRDADTQVVIATDNMDTFRRFTVPALGLDKDYDEILISSELGALKDDYENGVSLFFQGYMTKNNLNFRDTLLLDDSVDNMPICGELEIPAINIKSPQHLAQELKKLVE